MGKGSTTSSGQPSRSLGSKGGTSLPPSYENRSSQPMNSGLGAIFNQNQPQQYQPQPSYTESPETTIGHFGMDEYGRGFGEGFGGPPPDQGGMPSPFNMGLPNPYAPDQGGEPSRFNMGLPNPYRGPNPYAMPFENRYVQQFRPTPAPFVPVSAKDYVSPFQVSPSPVPRPTSRFNPLRGKGGSSQPTRGEQTYFNRPIETAPAPVPASAPAPAPAYEPSYDYSSLGAASGGVVKSAAGRYLQGPGDGTSDSIPATIGNTQPARLADGEFVIDARTVSEIGNGSSNAGAKKLYAMMERVHRERKKAKRGQNTNADRFLPV